MKRLLLIGIVLLMAQLAYGQILFTAYQSDNDPVYGDAFSFVTTEHLASAIHVGDGGWDPSIGIRPGEGRITYTPPTGGLPCGTVVTVAGDTTWNDAGILGANLSGTPLALSYLGDQLLAWSGTEPTPANGELFITAINMEGNGWQASATNSHTSGLPPTLPGMAFSLDETDNAMYRCVSSVPSHSVVYVGSDWERSNTPITQTPCSFVCSPSSTPAVASVELKVTPTLVESLLSIDSPGVAAFVYDMTGRLVYRCIIDPHYSTHVDLSALPTGYYIVSSGGHTKKIFKT